MSPRRFPATRVQWPAGVLPAASPQNWLQSLEKSRLMPSCPLWVGELWVERQSLQGPFHCPSKGRWPVLWEVATRRPVLHTCQDSSPHFL